MASLKQCLQQLGLGEHEAAILLGSQQELMSEEDLTAKDAAERAINDHISSLLDERRNLIQQVLEQKPEFAEPAVTVDDAAHIAATSPENDLLQPTAAQKEAGNYQKGHIQVMGLDIAIENPQGSRRRPEWPELNDHYGYFNRTEGKDGEQIDVFVKPGIAEDWQGNVYVIDQINPETGKFDEHKVMLGYGSQGAARVMYKRNYTKGWQGLGAITEMTQEQFKEWLAKGRTKKPVSDSVEAAPGTDIATTSPGLRVEFMGKSYPVESLADASRKWDQVRETGNFGASELEAFPLVYEGVTLIGYIAYNGKIFAGHPDSDSDQLLYPTQEDTRIEWYEASAKSVQVQLNQDQSLRELAVALSKGFKDTQTNRNRRDKEITSKIMEILPGIVENVAGYAMPDSLREPFKHYITEALNNPQRLKQVVDEYINRNFKPANPTVDVSLVQGNVHKEAMNNVGVLQAAGQHYEAFKSALTQALLDAIETARKNAKAQNKSAPFLKDYLAALDQLMEGNAMNPAIFGDQYFNGALTEANKVKQRQEAEKRRAEWREASAQIMADYLAKEQADNNLSDEDVGVLQAGWDHALGGGTLSNLPTADYPTPTDLPLLRSGYEAAQNFMAEYKVGAKRGAKMEGIGPQLKRMMDLRWSTALAADEAIRKGIEDIFKHADRASSFPFILDGDATPGTTLAMEYVRSKLSLPKQWVSRKITGYNYKDPAGMLEGYVYTSNKSEGRISKSSVENEGWQKRLDEVRDAATEYVNTMNNYAHEYFYNMRTVEDVFKGYRSYLMKVEGDSEHAAERVAKSITYRFDDDQAAKRGGAVNKLIRPKFDRVEREGLRDHRKGKNITLEELQTTFGFKGITVGNYVTSTQLQDHSNYAYDAFMDLAEKLGWELAQIGFGNRLVLAFGALGHGRHAAHYSNRHPVLDQENNPTGEVTPVINLTNTHGDGTVNHEYFHAIDYMLRNKHHGQQVAHDDETLHPYLQQFIGLLRYQLTTPEKMAARVADFLSGHTFWTSSKHNGRLWNARHAITRLRSGLNGFVRNGERGDAWSSAGSQTDYFKHANALGKDYWGNKREMFARAAEAFVFDTLGGMDTYLVSDWVADGKVTKSAGYRGTPYPVDEERQAFNELFEQFLKDIAIGEDGYPVIKVAEDQYPIKKHIGELLEALDKIENGLPAGNKVMRSSEAKIEAEAKALKDKAAQEKAEEEVRQLRESMVDSPTFAPPDDIQDLSTEDLENLFDEALSETEEAEQENTGTDQKTPATKLVAALFERGFKTPLSWQDLFKLADQAYGGTQAEGVYTPRDAYDAMEIAFNQWLLTNEAVVRDIKLSDMTTAKTELSLLNSAINNLTTQTKRTEEQMEFQQFSTPHTIAYVMARAANLNRDDIVLEPSAGTGNLATLAQMFGANSLILNELSDRRANLLEMLTTEHPTREDAAHLHDILAAEEVPTVVIMNPPFTATAGRVPGSRDSSVSMNHIEQALTRLAPGGRLVALVGEGLALNKAQASGFWREIQRRYNVRANIGLSGEGYRKFGTTFDKQIVIIDKTGPTTSIILTTEFKANNALENLSNTIEALEEIRNDRVYPGEQYSDQSGRQETAGYGSRAGDAVPATTGAAGTATGQFPAGAGVEPVGDVAAQGGDEDTGRSGVEPTGGQRPGSAGTGRRPGSGAQLDRGGHGRELTDILTEAADHGAKGVSEALTGLYELFGGNALKSFPAGFDDLTYARAKPHFEKAWSEFKAAGKSLKEFFKFLIRNFGEGVRPYAIQFANELTQNGDNGKTTNKNIEITSDYAALDRVENIMQHQALTDAVFDAYQPFITLPGSKPHPGTLVESAAMATVTPPSTSYVPNLPKKAIESGALSNAQIEQIIRAGDAHDKMLPNGERRGYFIGDGCVAGDTLILNPDTGIETPIKTLAEAGRPIRVLSLTADGFEAFNAQAPFKKGEDDLYRVVMQSGRSVQVTVNHKFFTPSGWMRIVDGLSVGHFLASAEALPENDSASAQSIHAEDDPHYRQTPEDCLGRYSAYLRQCGVRLQDDPDNGQEFAPLQGDEHAHIPVHSCADGQDISGEYSHRRPSSGHLSKSNFSPLESRDPSLISNPELVDDAQQSPSILPTHGQFAGGSVALHHSTGADAHHLQAHAARLSQNENESECHISLEGRPQSAVSRHNDSQVQSLEHQPDNLRLPAVPPALGSSFVVSSCQYYGGWDRIVSIELSGRAEFYDMWVPGPENYIAGGLVHHNTGLGKAREVVGVMTDNIRRGRKRHIWITKDDKLLDLARRDWNSVTGEDANKIITNIKRWKPEDPITLTEGVLFVSYGTLRQASTKSGGKSRMEQIADWLGPDFDGVIAFDEAHKLGNVIAMKGKRGRTKPSQTALTGVELQTKVPQARILYVSATGATEVNNLGYASRLGLWGEGTPFADNVAFIEAISSKGVAAMELVAQDMKALGMYGARSLSYHDVTYGQLTHALTPEQVEMYDVMAEGWQVILQNIGVALEAIGAVNEEGKVKAKNAKSSALSAFWGAHQRFFNQVLTSMQMPSLIEDIEKRLEEEHSIVLQLVNTNEAQTERAAAQAANEGISLDELDITPRQSIMQFLESSFPIHKYEETVDSNGNKIMTLVEDSQGNPVISAEAVAIRDQMLDMIATIAIPHGPLDQIIDHFGVSQVAEVTGRSRRLVTKKGKKAWERRSATAVGADISQFMEDKKKIMVFSDAGGTGQDFHADLRRKNQRKRFHYLVQPGWRADNAVQGFGRTHRSNQKQAPHYVLVTTDLKGHLRFISSVARRLDQLGALTKGQREAGSQGIFSAEHNLETVYSEEALRGMVRDLARNKLEGMEGLSIATLEHEMWINLRDEEGNVSDKKTPTIQQFLNRILSLKTARQNEVFEAFFHRLQQVVDYHREIGDFDVGIENVTGDRVEKKEERIVHTHEGTSAVTKYVRLNVETPLHPMTFTEFLDLAERRKVLHEAVYAVNELSNKFAAFLPTVDKTTKEGKVVKQLRRYDPTGSKAVEYSEVVQHKYHDGTYYMAGNWKQIESLESAATHWQEAFETAPKIKSADTHMIVGAVLPIWSRIVHEGDRSVRVVRAQTTDSHERFIGMQIPSAQINAVLKNLGAERASVQMLPAELHNAVMKDGKTLILANGWQIAKRMVSGEQRMELILPAADRYRWSANLQDRGLISERINYTARFFFPLGKMEPFKITIKNDPVVEIAGEPDEDMLMSRGAEAPVMDTSTGPSGEAVEQYLRDKLGHKAWKQLMDSGRFKIISTKRELPNWALAENAGDVAGWFDRKAGKTFLIANRLSLNEADINNAYAVLLHEVGVHYGMPQMLGDKLWIQTKAHVAAALKLAKRGVNGKLNEAAANAALKVPDDTSRSNYTEEVIAYMVQERANQELPLVKRILAAIKRFLYQLGLIRNLDPNMLVSMAVAAIRQTTREEVSYRPPVPAQPAEDAASINRTRLADVWQSYIARGDQAFQAPPSDAKDLKTLVQDIAAGYDWTVEEQTQPPIFVIKVPKTDEIGQYATPIVTIHNPDTKAPFAEIFSPGGRRRGGGGARAYQIAMAWARNNNKVLVPDRTITVINRLRRTEAMISSMLKYGTSEHLEPHIGQFIGLLPDDMYNQLDEQTALADVTRETDRHSEFSDRNWHIRERLEQIKVVLWRPETNTTSSFEKRQLYFNNLEAMLLASAALAQRRLPDLKNIIFKDGQYYVQGTAKHFATGINPQGRPVIRLISTFPVGMGIADTTAQRAVITASVLQSDYAGWVEKLGRVAGQYVPGTTQKHPLLAQGIAGSLVSDLDSIGIDALDNNLLYSRDTTAATAPTHGEFAQTLEHATRRLDPIRYVIQDKFIDLKHLQEDTGGVAEDEDVYMAESIWQGRAGEQLDRFNRDKIEPMLEMAGKTGLAMAELDEWLHARHASEANEYLQRINPEREDNTALSGMSDAEAESILAKHRDNDALQRFGTLIDEINAARVKLLIQGDLISEEMAAAWQANYQHYVPLKRDEAHATLPSRGQGFSVRGPESKRRLGSTRDVVDVLVNVVAQYEASIIRSEKNRVAQALLKFAQKHKDSSFWTVDVPKKMGTVKDGEVKWFNDPREYDNELKVKVDGQVHTITFNQKNEVGMRILKAMKNLDHGDIGRLTRVLLGLNRFLAQLNTSWSPEFVISNFARDLQTALYNMTDTELSKAELSVLKMVPGALKGLRANLRKGDRHSEWGGWAERFRLAGGKTGWIEHYRDINERSHKLADQMKRIQAGKSGRNAFMKLLDFIDDYNSVVENGIRLAAFRKAVELGLSDTRAAALAKNLTVNFNRRGMAGPTLNAMYLFYNASIQGSVRMLQAMLTSKKGRRLALATIGVAIVLDIINRAAAGDDDDGENYYDALPDHIRERYWVIMGEKEPIFKFMLPWGYNALHVVGQQFGELMTGERFDAWHSASRIGAAIAEAFNPVGHATFLQTLAPTVVDPFVQIAENKDWTGRPLKPQEIPFGPAKPQYLQHWSSAREVSKEFTKFLNDISGGDEIRPGAVDISPEWVDVFVDFSTGSAGRVVMDSFNLAHKAVTGEQIEVREVPMLRRLYGYDNKYAISQRYYERSMDVQYVDKQIKQLQGEERLKAIQSPQARLRLLDRSVRNQLRDLRKRRRDIQANDILPSDEKKRRIDDIDSLIRKRQAFFNRRYAETVLTPN